MPKRCDKPISLDELCVRVTSKKKVTFRTIQQRYGDGYTARRQDGLNPVDYVWDVKTPIMSVADAQALEAELIDNGVGFFSWTAPHETSPRNWMLDPVAWDWDYETCDLVSLSFSLRIWNGS